MDEVRASSVAVGEVGGELAGQFFTLTPERVLEAVEEAGQRTTGLCYALNSLENRVFEVELDGGTRLVGKFYRPGRWSRAAILEEHRLLAALVENEIPAVAPLAFADGETLRQTPEGIWFALFPRCGGRCPEELDLAEYRELGRLLGRIHNVAARQQLQHRPLITPATYGREALAVILSHAPMPDVLRERYSAAVSALVALGERAFAGVGLQPLHGDCHKGNLLRGRDGFFFLDFDDLGVGPAAQDLWLLLPGRRRDSRAELEALLEGYELFRAFERPTLRLIEILRGLRYVRYAAWIAQRWRDPSFPRAFPDFGGETYWHNQIADLYEQLRVIEDEDTPLRPD